MSEAEDKLSPRAAAEADATDAPNAHDGPGTPYAPGTPGAGGGIHADRPQKAKGPDRSQFAEGPVLDAGAPSEDSPESEARACESPGEGYRITPMFEQYLELKRQYPDALLFYRMGDFYELFFEDARTAARELQLALTSRGRGEANPVPMCGVPWHAMETYASQLVAKGYSLAVCEQTEDPKQAKGLVKRAVTRVITPGTVFEDEHLAGKRHNYLACLCADQGRAGLAWADVSTGEWSGIESAESACWQWLGKYAPSELLLQEGVEPPRSADLSAMRVVRRRRQAFDLRQAEARLLEIQHVKDLGALGLQASPLLTRSAGALASYLVQTQKRQPDHMLPFRPLDTGACLVVDELSERNLELFQRLNGAKGRGTLLHALDATATPMGGRLLESMLRSPLRSIEAIEAIQDACACFLADDRKRRALREALEGVFDLERLSTRIHLQRAMPKDFMALANSLRRLPQVKACVEAFGADGREGAEDAAHPGLPPSLALAMAGWDDLEDVSAELEACLAEPAPQTITEGGIFKAGWNPELDRLLELTEHSEQALQELFEADQARCQVKLKFGNSRVFGYYYAVSRAQQAEALPEDFVRRQTVAAGERYTTPGLKALEQAILEAAEKRRELEFRLFQDLRAKAAAWRPRLLEAARRAASIDYWQSLAEKARACGWTRPKLVQEPVIRIQEGRHPVVEESLGRSNFVPNSFTLDERRRLCLLTGPNMAGKSTVLRQTAILCIMAQMGSFVPAQAAELGIVDRLFTRVGASDNLAQGQSTFMVEMMETARILRQCTKRSLVVLDEIGRGTSTYDGLALAWAVAEDLAQRFGGAVRTLFATHYHELTQLEGQIPGVFTMNVAIRESGRDILFLHKLLPGPVDRSYGVEVAKLAGVPRSVVARARELLNRFEELREASRRHFKSVLKPALLPGLELLEKASAKTDASKARRVQADPAAEAAARPQAHPLVQILADLKPEALTPLEALKLVSQWKELFAGSAEGEGCDCQDAQACRNGQAGQEQRP
jgi:DNA mismatch repair protein MutS